MNKISKNHELRFLVLFIAFGMSISFDKAGAHVWLSDDPIRSKTIRVGLRHDTKPFSYPHENLSSVTILPQHKGFMVEVCRRVLEKMKESPEYAHVKIKSVSVTAKSRFDDLLTGKVDILCGPDSITKYRLKHYNISHPMFLSGMTYGYLNPISRRFPRTEYCGHILGVVNNTTAEQTGISRLSHDDLLMRFDHAIDLQLALDGERHRVVQEKAEFQRLKLTKYFNESADFLETAGGQNILHAIRQRSVETATYINCFFETANLERYIESKVIGYSNDPGVNKAAQIEIRKKIVTNECPNGFTQGMPVRKFEDHNEGIEAFCDGEVLYYLGDYDILHAKVSEHAKCDVIFNRFTTNKEVYAAFFRSDDVSSDSSVHCTPPKTTPDEANLPKSSYINKAQSATLYADFNRTLLQLMQSNTNILDSVYESEFDGDRMSTDLREFFDSFRVASDLGQPDK